MPEIRRTNDAINRAEYRNNRDRMSQQRVGITTNRYYKANQHRLKGYIKQFQLNQDGTFNQTNKEFQIFENGQFKDYTKVNKNNKRYYSVTRDEDLYVQETPNLPRDNYYAIEMPTPATPTITLTPTDPRWRAGTITRGRPGGHYQINNNGEEIFINYQETNRELNHQNLVGIDVAAESPF